MRPDVTAPFQHIVLFPSVPLLVLNAMLLPSHLIRVMACDTMLPPSCLTLSHLPFCTCHCPPSSACHQVPPVAMFIICPPSPPPWPSHLLSMPSLVINYRHSHVTIPAQQTPSWHATLAFSPLPPSSPFAEEADLSLAPLSSTLLLPVHT